MRQDWRISDGLWSSDAVRGAASCTSDDENAATPRVERSMSSGHIQTMLRPDINRNTLHNNAIRLGLT